MNFSTASRVSEVVNAMKIVEVNRARNRALIDNLFNGVPPYTAQEEKENSIYVNVNWKEGPNTLHAARGQYENAFLKPGNFFKVTLDDAPIDKQAEWSRIVTKEINRALKKSRPYIHTQRSKFAGVVLHGVGCQMWEDDENPIPYFVGMQDILIPTDTDITLENLPAFAVGRKMKPGELYRKTFAKGENIDPGWNKKAVAKILDNLKNVNISPQPSFDFTNHPEQMAELFKQNCAYYDSDRMPEIWMWDFYHQEDGQDKDKAPGWYRKIILDSDCVTSNTGDASKDLEFIFDGKKPVASELDQFIHFQFGDGNNVPPFKYHSIRSLGWLLFDTVQLINRLRCQFTQHVFEQMLTLLRVNDPADRARVSKIMLADKGILPEGVQIVPASERFQVDQGLVGGLLANLKQLITESSSAYTQQIDTGTQKERTKFEVEAIMSQISSLMSSLLNLAYTQEFFSYLEICRRFTKKNSSNFMVKKFISSCVKQGVPEKHLDSERWTVEVEQVIGAGNKMLEIAQARELRAMRPTLDPEAQREVDRIYIGALTDNAKLAERLIPEGATVTDAMHDAELAFGTLMQGVQMSVKEGLNHHEQVTTLLRLLGQAVKRVNDMGGVGTPEDVIGFQTVAEYIEKHIEIIAQNPDEKAKVKEYGDILSNFMNFVRAFAQRQEEAMKKAQQEQEQGQVDPAAVAQAQLAIESEKADMAMKQQQHEQDMRIKQETFAADQARKDAEAVSSIARKDMQATATANAAAEKPAPNK